MFVKRIRLERAATILENSVEVARHDAGSLLTTILAHPDLRSCTIIQGCSNEAMLVSERPLTEACSGV
jgi:hypothetical protein